MHELNVDLFPLFTREGGFHVARHVAPHFCSRAERRCLPSCPISSRTNTYCGHEPSNARHVPEPVGKSQHHSRDVCRKRGQRSTPMSPALEIKVSLEQPVIRCVVLVSVCHLFSRVFFQEPRAELARRPKATGVIYEPRATPWVWWKQRYKPEAQPPANSWHPSGMTRHRNMRKRCVEQRGRCPGLVYQALSGQRNFDDNLFQDDTLTPNP